MALKLSEREEKSIGPSQSQWDGPKDPISPSLLPIE